uniref:Sodium-coupled neutral amino acid transporter 1-like protein n=1 Tax=Callorhinchus milii TaxID=7868 RepID=V9KGV6_CALMI
MNNLETGFIAKVAEEDLADLGKGPMDSKLNHAKGLESEKHLASTDVEKKECQEHNNGIASFGMSVFNLSNAIIGSGLLGLSYAMANTGIVLFVILLIGVMLLSLYSIHLLLNISTITGSMVYETLGEKAFGKPGKFIVFGATSLQNTGAILSYLFIVKNELPFVIKSFVDVNSQEWYLNGSYLIIIVTLVIILPLCLFKNLGYLGYTSGFSLACMIFFLIVVIWKKTEIPCPFTVSNSSCISDGVKCNAKYFVLNEKTVYALPTMAFAFVCQPSLLPIYSELKNRTSRRMKKVSNISVFAMFIMYLLTAIFGYLTFYDDVNSELLCSYSDKRDQTILIVRLAVITAVILTVPVLLFTIRSSILLIALKGKFSWFWHIITTLVLLIACNVLVILIPSIKDVFAVIGSSSANMLIFIIPASLYLKLAKDETVFTLRKMGTVLFLIAGIIFMLVNLPLIIIEWTHRDSNTTTTESCTKEL